MRSGSPEALIEGTDNQLVRSRAIPRRLLTVLAEARLLMLSRRLDRNAAGPTLDRIDWREVA